MSEVDCSECGSDIKVAIWDDGILFGAIIPVCYDCKDDVPEFCLWDVSALEEAHKRHSDGQHPNLMDDHPLDEDEEWAIWNRYGSKEQYLTYLEATSDTADEELRDEIDVPEEDCWEIFVWDRSNTEAIEEAREELQERL